MNVWALYLRLVFGILIWKPYSIRLLLCVGHNSHHTCLFFFANNVLFNFLIWLCWVFFVFFGRLFPNRGFLFFVNIYSMNWFIFLCVCFTFSFFTLFRLWFNVWLYCLECWDFLDWYWFWLWCAIIFEFLCHIDKLTPLLTGNCTFCDFDVEVYCELFKFVVFDFL